MTSWHGGRDPGAAQHRGSDPGREPEAQPDADGDQLEELLGAHVDPGPGHAGNGLSSSLQRPLKGL